MSATIGLYPTINEVIKFKPITLNDFLQDIQNGRWEDAVLKVRTAKGEALIKKAKSELPYVTISGSFKKRNNSGLDKHSGFLAVDMDKLGPKLLGLKEDLSNDPLFYSVFISCGGNGLCGIVKINPKAHLESFYFMSEHLFEKYDINIDDKCKDVSRPRYVSYDPDIYINENSQLTPVKPLPKRKEDRIHNYLFIDTDFQKIIDEIVNRELDLTGDYKDWLYCGFSFAEQFGENGREYFHAISQFNHNYSRSKTDAKYSHLLNTRSGDITIDWFYQLVQKNGIKAYSKETEALLRAAQAAKEWKIIDGEQGVKESLHNSGLTDEKIAELEPSIKKALSGKIKRNDDNLVLDLMEFMAHSYKLKHNLISRNIELNGEPIDDKDINSIFLRCKTVIPKATKDIVTSILFSDYVQSYNPFIELINKYKDAPPTRGHIDALISTIVTDTPNYSLFVKKWLVSIIASVHGYHSPLVLVLCGEQNSGKTQWFRRLLPKCLHKYYAESRLDEGKDAEILMTKKIIIMDDEYGGKSKQEHKKLNGMTSKETFSIREPYGRVSVDLRRLAMLCGTSNSEELLSDPTGNRRILPVRVLSVKKEEYNKIDKELLFYELYLEYMEGYDYELTAEEIKLLADSTGEFRQSNIEEEMIAKYYAIPGDVPGEVIHLTNTEILQGVQLKSGFTLSQTKLGLILKQMGFKQKQKKINGVPIRVYDLVEVSDF